MNTTTNNQVPKYPTFSPELVEQCTLSRDYRPILFEWYKYVGVLSINILSISPKSQSFKNVPSVHHAVLVGLLNRCSRLMLANVRLSSTRRYGETTILLDRSIAESAITIQWLCHKDNTDSFVRYLSNGLKQDIVLKKQIEKNIKDRKRDTLVIEQRMLNSIKNNLDLSNLCEEEVLNAKKLPDFASMCRDLQYGDILYTAIYRMGSHAVHGTWSDLGFNYIQYSEELNFHPQEHDKETQDSQYISIIHLLIGAMISFIKYILYDTPDREEIIRTLQEIDDKITEIQHLAWNPDFSITTEN